MKRVKVLLILFLPLTLLLDFIMYAALKTCPSCGTFSAFIQQQEALSFPVVMGMIEWFHLKGIIRMKQMHNSSSHSTRQAQDRQLTISAKDRSASG